MAQEPISVVVYIKDGMVDRVQSTLASPEKTLKVYVVDYDLCSPDPDTFVEIETQACTIEEVAVGKFTPVVNDVILKVQTTPWDGPVDEDDA